jgi:hypothetical protein
VRTVVAFFAGALALGVAFAAPRGFFGAALVAAPLVASGFLAVFVVEVVALVALVGAAFFVEAGFWFSFAPSALALEASLTLPWTPRERVLVCDGASSR